MTSLLSHSTATAGYDEFCSQCCQSLEINFGTQPICQTIILSNKKQGCIKKKIGITSLWDPYFTVKRNAGYAIVVRGFQCLHSMTLGQVWIPGRALASILFCLLSVLLSGWKRFDLRLSRAEFWTDLFYNIFPWHNVFRT